MTTHSFKRIKGQPLSPVQRQANLCARLKQPLWIPRDGICSFCHYPIFNNVMARHKAHTQVITSCPDCRRSFCD